MSKLIGEARARLLGYSDKNGEVDRLGGAASELVLPPIDESVATVDLNAYADPFADGNEGGFDLVWNYKETPPPSTVRVPSAPSRTLRSAGPSHESSRAVGRMWNNFAMTESAFNVLGQLAG